MCILYIYLPYPNICLYFWDKVLCTLFTFFGLLSSSLSPCLSQRFGRCTLRPSSGGWNVELSPLFRSPGQTVLIPRAMFYGCQLSVISPVNSSPPRLKDHVNRIKKMQGHMAQWIKALVRSSDVPKKSVGSILSGGLSEGKLTGDNFPWTWHKFSF